MKYGKSLPLFMWKYKKYLFVLNFWYLFYFFLSIDSLAHRKNLYKIGGCKIEKENAFFYPMGGKIYNIWTAQEVLIPCL